MTLWYNDLWLGRRADRRRRAGRRTCRRDRRLRARAGDLRLSRLPVASRAATQSCRRNEHDGRPAASAHRHAARRRRRTALGASRSHSNAQTLLTLHAAHCTLQPLTTTTTTTTMQFYVLRMLHSYTATQLHSLSTLLTRRSINFTPSLSLQSRIKRTTRHTCLSISSLHFYCLSFSLFLRFTTLFIRRFSCFLEVFSYLG